MSITMLKVLLRCDFRIAPNIVFPMTLLQQILRSQYLNTRKKPNICDSVDN